MKMRKVLRDLGFGDVDAILSKIGRARIKVLLDEMLVGIEPLYAHMWKTSYGIGCPSKSHKEIGLKLNPKRTSLNVGVLVRRINKMLLHESRIHILTHEIKSRM